MLYYTILYYKMLYSCFFGTLGPSTSRCGRTCLGRHLQFDSMQEAAGSHASSDPALAYPVTVNRSLKICIA